ncbi:MAG: BACON domain-containing protein [Acidobacteria bacterium]|nr:BACON domain-containing protein [Acidobacteriota bacterium]
MKRTSVASLIQAVAVLATLAVIPASAQFAASQTSLSFPNTGNPSNPNIGFVTITSSNPSSVAFTLSATTNSGGQWLTAASTFGNTTPATLQVSVNTAGLTTGFYTGTVTVTSSTGVPQPLAIQVNLTVGSGSGGSFTLSTTNITFNSPSGPLSQSVTLTSTAVTSYTTASNQTWLTVSPSTGSGLSTYSFTVSANPAGLTNGTLSGIVFVTANNSTQQINVTFNVGGGGGGSGNVSPSSLTFSTLVNGTALNQSFTFTPGTVTTVNHSITYSVTGQNWLTVLQQTQGQAVSQAIFNVGVNTAGLGIGTYNATINLSAATGSAASVSVSLVISQTGGGGSITVSPQSVSLSYQIGGLAPQQVINISNLPIGASYTVTNSYVSGAGWLSNIIGSLTGSQFSLSTNPASLGQGQYSANVVLAFTTGQNIQIPVTLTVTGTGGGGGGTSLSPSSLSFFHTSGSGVNPATQVITLSAPAGQNFTASASISSGTGWLSVFPTSGTTGTATTLTVQVSPQFLNIGGYNGTITVVVGGQTLFANISLTVSTTGGTGGVSVSPSSLVFNFTPGGNVPVNQTVTLSTPTATNFSLVATGTSGSVNWLAVGPVSGVTTFTGASATAGLSVGLVNVSSLPLGTYQGSVNITTGSGNVTLGVTLNVGVAGTTSSSISPSQLTFTFQASTATPPAQLVTINTANGTTSSFTATPTTTTGVNWLSVNQTSGTAPGVFAVIVNPHILQAGTHTGNISVLVGGPGTPVNIPVTIHVLQGSPVLRTNLTSATFNYQIGGTTPAGQGQSVDLGSTGTNLTVTTSFSVNSGGNWLSVTPASLSTPTTASIGVNATGLAAGTYTGVVNFTTQGGQTTPIPVTLNVSNSPLLNANPQTLQFSTAAGTTPAQMQNSFNVGTTGTSVLATATAVAMNNGSWLSVSPTSALSTPTNFTVTVNPAGLAQDTFYGVIIVNTSSQGQAGNAPIIVPVVYTNGGTSGGGGSGAFTVTPSTLTFTQIQGGAAPAAQALSVSAGSVTPFTASTSTTSGGSWLSVSPITGTTPGSVQVSVAAGGLGLGTYNGFVIVTPSVTNPSPSVIPVTLSVITSPTMVVSPTALTFDFQTGGSTPASQTLTVGATAGASAALLNFSATFTTASGGSWLTVTPQSGTTPGSLTVSASPTGLPLGTYSGTITITSVAVNSPFVIPVTFTVRQRTQVLSQIADGSNWRTGITLVNLDTAAAAFTLRFYDDNGNPLALLTDALSGRSNTIEGTIPVGGVRTINTLGIDATLSQGWVELSTTRTLNGTAVFRQRSDRGDQEAGVPLTGTINRFVLAFDNVDNFVTSMAIVNTNASQTVATNLIIRDEQGNQLSTDTIVMGPRVHQAFALPDRLPVTRGRRGSVEFSTNGSDITGLGLRFNPGGAFTSFPVLPK